MQLNLNVRMIFLLCNTSIKLSQTKTIPILPFVTWASSDHHLFQMLSLSTLGQDNMLQLPKTV